MLRATRVLPALRHCVASSRCYATSALEQDDKKFSETFKILPQAYTKFDVNDAVFDMIGAGARASPGMHRSDPQLANQGHRHLVPWAMVKFAHMTLKGTMGQMEYDGNVLDNPNKAKMEIILSDEHLTASGSNDDMVDYISYIESLFDRFVDYLVDNPTAVPALSEYAAMSRADRLEAIKECTVSPVKTTAEYTKEIKFNSKVFRPHRGGTLQEFGCDFDKEIHMDYGLARNHIPVFDPSGEVVPLEQQAIYGGDVVGLQVTIKPLVWNTGFEGPKVAFQKNIDAVVLRRRGGMGMDDNDADVTTNPFQF